MNNNDNIRRWTHTPITTDMRGIEVSINEKGKVTFSKVVKDKNGDTVKDENGDDVVDEIEVSASIIFDTARLLTATRKATYIDISDKKT